MTKTDKNEVVAFLEAFDPKEGFIFTKKKELYI